MSRRKIYIHVDSLIILQVQPFPQHTHARRNNFFSPCHVRSGQASTCPFSTSLSVTMHPSACANSPSYPPVLFPFLTSDFLVLAPCSPAVSLLFHTVCLLLPLLSNNQFSVSLNHGVHTRTKTATDTARIRCCRRYTPPGNNTSDRSSRSHLLFKIFILCQREYDLVPLGKGVALDKGVRGRGKGEDRERWRGRGEDWKGKRGCRRLKVEKRTALAVQGGARGATAGGAGRGGGRFDGGG